MSAILAVAIALAGAAAYSAAQRWRRDGRGATVVVLGDIGRSPRMQNHAVSLAKQGMRVTIVGARGSTAPREVTELATMRYLPSISMRGPFLLTAACKVCVQVVSLVWMLASTPTSVMMVQTPPAVPTLVVCRVMCLLHGTRMIVDWHNFAYSLLALKLGSKHPVVRVSRVYEAYFAHYAQVYANLCVSKAMAEFMRREFHISATVVYDRPHFTPMSAHDRQTYRQTRRIHAATKLVVSSTSWTEDEDFKVLLDALVRYDASRKPPRLHIIITGRGPQKEGYDREIAALRLTAVTIETAWLEADEYPKLLGAADLGVCLHTSSSGVDLPMKIVDMFGCGLPVAAFDYPALHELVVDGCGVFFSTEKELCNHLLKLFNSNELDVMRLDVEEHSRWRWEDEWNEKAGLR